MNLAQRQLKPLQGPPSVLLSNVDVGFARLQSNNAVVLTGPLCTVCLTVEPDGRDLNGSSSVLMKVGCTEYSACFTVLFFFVFHQTVFL